MNFSKYGSRDKTENRSEKGRREQKNRNKNEEENEKTYARMRQIFHENKIEKL